MNITLGLIENRGVMKRTAFRTTRGMVALSFVDGSTAVGTLPCEADATIAVGPGPMQGATNGVGFQILNP